MTRLVSYKYPMNYQGKEFIISQFSTYFYTQIFRVFFSKISLYFFLQKHLLKHSKILKSIKENLFKIFDFLHQATTRSGFLEQATIYLD